MYNDLKRMLNSMRRMLKQFSILNKKFSSQAYVCAQIIISIVQQFCARLNRF